MKQIVVFSILFFFFCFYTRVPLHADQDKQLSDGQTIYVPAYSHIYTGDSVKPFLLTVTLSIRNIDPQHQIRIKAVDYFETKGRLINKHIQTPVILDPLETIRYIIPERDKSGGSGANFIVVWESDKLMNSPIVESIMIGTRSGQGVSFISRGRAILTTNLKKYPKHN